MNTLIPTKKNLHILKLLLFNKIAQALRVLKDMMKRIKMNT